MRNYVIKVKVATREDESERWICLAQTTNQQGFDDLLTALLNVNFNNKLQIDIYPSENEKEN